jgi:chemotaxis protein MotB
MANDEKKPVIIVKKNGRHGGHHGGAWKVAYADFVTAMMAFFLVMWLVTQSTEVKEAVAHYFKDPVHYKERIGAKVIDGGVGVLEGGTPRETGGDGTETPEEIERKHLELLKKQIEQAIGAMPGLEILRDRLDFLITHEGLRIQIIEGSKDLAFFRPGSAVLTLKGELIIKTIAQELRRITNQLVIEGHTDASKAGLREDYTNWELSTDRANAARRAMMEAGLGKERIYQVRGYADNKPRVKDPYDPSNRRISILVLNRFANKDAPEDSYDTPIVMSR